MQAGVTLRAQSDQVLFRIIAALATKLLVVNLQIRPSPAALASPAHRGAAPAPGVGYKTRDRVVHEAVWVTSGSPGLLADFVQKGLPLVAGVLINQLCGETRAFPTQAHSRERKHPFAFR